jgi:transcriptional regulator with XRE-family HTH domain
MGQPRWRPTRLAKKLRRIRAILKLSQPKLHKELGVEEEIDYNRISDYERNKFDPPLPVLAQYARVARIHLEVIVDDRLDLPKTLPGTVKYEAWNRPLPKRRRSKKRKTKKPKKKKT